MYQMGNVGVLLLAAILACREQRTPSPLLRGLLFIAGMVLAALLPGANDVTLLLTLFLLASGTGAAFRARRPTVAFWASLLVVGLLASAVSGLAPGNYARVESIAVSPMLRPQPLLAAVLFLPWTVLRAAYWLSSLGLWAGTLLLLDASWQWARGLLYRDGTFDRRYLRLPVVWTTAYLALSLPRLRREPVSPARTGRERALAALSARLVSERHHPGTLADRRDARAVHHSSLYSRRGAPHPEHPRRAEQL